MRRLIYTSRSRIHADPLELNAILAVSSARNSEADITGVLWSDGTNFAQIVEGGWEAVGATMDRLRADPRHTDINVAFDREVQTRQFGNWAMILANDGESATAATAYMIGVSLNERKPSAERLREVILRSENLL
ncbi:BLUF domain-containing protein [Sphingomonas xinjiangensis]|uniref:BLUF domain-containing protein n=1 Tax=Sphingomonas xinjiangensis TaxID=643568 RepID=A0A840YD97_9SPHN|nr:BLUF domain-containing protein [Sphingomonas xinjiangensis]MBB5710824.1 hypothetical protein [Sphingomonas xinjiangensis]